jgi:hypothetical protein
MDDVLMIALFAVGLLGDGIMLYVVLRWLNDDGAHRN